MFKLCIRKSRDLRLHQVVLRDNVELILDKWVAEEADEMKQESILGTRAQCVRKIQRPTLSPR